MYMPLVRLSSFLKRSLMVYFRLPLQIFMKVGDTDGLTLDGVVQNSPSSPSTTFVVEKIDKIEKLIIEEKVTLADDESKPLEMVASSCEYDSEDDIASVDNDMSNFLAKKDGYGTQSLLEQWTKSYENADYRYDPYDDDMYEGSFKLFVTNWILQLGVLGRNSFLELLFLL
ncbi:hypothetical protein Tco_0344494 [Tanacetum coccineum]